MTAINLNPTEPWSPNTVDPDAKPIHIVQGPARRGEEAVALCGARWKVEQVHSHGPGGSTCQGCIARLLTQ